MQQLYVFYGIIGFTILLGSLLFLVYWSLSKEQQRKQAAWEQFSILAEVTAQEKQKAQITYKLHEDFAQTLATVKMFMAHFKLRDNDDIDQRKQANLYLDDVITQIRGIALEYLPYALQKKNLSDALYDYVIYMNNQHGNLITLEIKEELSPLPTHTAVSIYRIVQEIVDNTVKHAQATELVISIKEENNKLLLVTKDNGRGFDDKQELKREKGMGLKSIINRIQLVKGLYKIDTVQGQGARYLIEIPL